MIYPNAQAALFGQWLISSDFIRFSTARVQLVNQVITAANSAGSVTDTQWNNFVYISNPYLSAWQQSLSQIQVYISPSGYDALTVAWLAAVTTPSQATIYAVDTFFKQLRADGNLSLDAFWLFSQDQQANAILNLMNPSLYAITEMNSPSWAAYQGYTGNGSNSYLKTGFIPSTAGGYYSLNSAIFGAYGRLNEASGNRVAMGVFDGTHYAHLFTNFSTGNKTIAVNANTDGTVAYTSTQGLLCAKRTLSTTQEYWQNGSQLLSSAITSSALPSKEFFIAAQNSNGTPALFSANQYTCAFVGGGSLNLTTLYSAINLLMTNLGAHY